MSVHKLRESMCVCARECMKYLKYKQQLFLRATKGGRTKYKNEQKKKQKNNKN